MSWANYDSVVQQMEAVGLQIDTLEPGRMRRVRTSDDRGAQKSGWYSLHELTTRSGECILVGAFGNWREGTDGAGRPVSHRVEIKQQTLTPEEKAAVRSRIAEERRKAVARRKHEGERAAKRAAHAWSKCSEQGGSDYLIRKGVQALGVRFSPGGNLVVPMHDEHGGIRGLQVIYSDADTKRRKGRDKDFWPAGLAKRGLFCLLGSPSWIVLVAEGYATAASLHMATGWPVAVAFDAGNLEPVAQKLRKRYRDAHILICADDDWLQKCAACGEVTTVSQPECEHCGEPHRKSNAGTNAASVAALAVNGAWMAPSFSDRGRDKLTDFNDLHQADGLHVVRAQLEARVDELGWRSNAPREAHADAALDPVHDFRIDIDVLLRDYALIYSTDTVFDGRRRMIMGLGPLRSAAGKSLVRMWLEHPDRRTVMPEQVQFAPEREANDPAICNLWGGWPTTPLAGGSCEMLLDLLNYLCSREDNATEVFQWVLKWLAYPIQHPGAKMQTALLMHGPEGTGKNTFFGVIRRIYDRYGCIFSQTELESQFNGWASGKLFAIGNEVVTRSELYQQQGRLKNMITETEWMINEKNLPTRLESNHCNFVFFSNRLDIAKLDKQDRRYCVVWTPEALDESFYADVAREIDEGGGGALHQYLLDMDLTGFSPHSKPPLTRAKAELIDIGLDSVERFWRDWSAGHLPVPFGPCLSQDLYQAYRHWAVLEGVPKAAPQYILLGSIGKKQGVIKRRERYQRGHGISQAHVVVPDRSEPTAGQTRQAWLGELLANFGDELSAWKAPGGM